MNLIFDFDGTICDSLETVVEIVNNQLPKYGKIPATSELVRKLGIKKLILESKIPKTQIPKFIKNSRQKMFEVISSLEIFPELTGVIIELSKLHTLGILTTNSEENARKFLSAHKLLKYFDFVYSELSVFGKHHKLKKILSKYSFATKETYYVGDETRDIEATKKIDIKSVAVTWGYESKSILAKLNPDYLISQPKELLNIFK